MKFKLDISDKLQKQLAKCADIDTIAPAMLDAAAPILIDAVKNRLSAHSTAGAARSKTYRIKGGRSKVSSWQQTGSLAKSFKGKKVKRSRSGGYVKAFEFTGYDSSHKTPVPNSVKAIQLEYGNSAQPAQPFRKAAMNDCTDEISENMQEVFNDMTGVTE